MHTCTSVYRLVITRPCSTISQASVIASFPARYVSLGAEACGLTANRRFIYLTPKRCLPSGLSALNRLMSSVTLDSDRIKRFRQD